MKWSLHLLSPSSGSLPKVISATASPCFSHSSSPHRLSGFISFCMTPCLTRPLCLSLSLCVILSCFSAPPARRLLCCVCQAFSAGAQVSWVLERNRSWQGDTLRKASSTVPTECHTRSHCCSYRCITRQNAAHAMMYVMMQHVMGNPTWIHFTLLMQWSDLTFTVWYVSHLMKHSRRSRLLSFSWAQVVIQMQYYLIWFRRFPFVPLPFDLSLYFYLYIRIYASIYSIKHP